MHWHAIHMLFAKIIRIINSRKAIHLYGLGIIHIHWAEESLIVVMKLRFYYCNQGIGVGLANVRLDLHVRVRLVQKVLFLFKTHWKLCLLLLQLPPIVFNVFCISLNKSKQSLEFVIEINSATFYLQIFPYSRVE